VDAPTATNVIDRECLITAVASIGAPTATISIERDFTKASCVALAIAPTASISVERGITTATVAASVSAPTANTVVDNERPEATIVASVVAPTATNNIERKETEITAVASVEAPTADISTKRKTNNVLLQASVAAPSGTTSVERGITTATLVASVAAPTGSVSAERDITVATMTASVAAPTANVETDRVETSVILQATVSAPTGNFVVGRGKTTITTQAVAIAPTASFIVVRAENKVTVTASVDAPTATNASERKENDAVVVASVSAPTAKMDTREFVIYSGVYAGIICDQYDGYSPLTVTVLDSPIPEGDFIAEADTIALSLLGYVDKNHGVDPLQFNNLGRVVYPNFMNFRWIFGDGTADDTEDKTPAHVYAYPGTYILRLEIDENNVKSAYEVAIDVYDGDRREDENYIYNISTNINRVAYQLGSNKEQGFGWSKQDSDGLVYPETDGSVFKVVTPSGEAINVAYDSLTGLPYIINVKSNYGIDKLTYKDKVDDLLGIGEEIEGEIKFTALTGSHERFQIRPSDLFAYIAPIDWANLENTDLFNDSGLRIGFNAEIELYIDKRPELKAFIKKIPYNRELYFANGQSKVGRIFEYKLKTNFADFVLRKLVGNLLVYDKARYPNQITNTSEISQRDLIGGLVHWKNAPNTKLNKINFSSDGNNTSVTIWDLNGEGFKSAYSQLKIYKPVFPAGTADVKYISIWSNVDKIPTTTPDSLAWKKLATITKDGYDDTLYLWVLEENDIKWEYGTRYGHIALDTYVNGVSGTKVKYFDLRMYNKASFESDTWDYYIDQIENWQAKGVCPYE